MVHPGPIREASIRLVMDSASLQPYTFAIFNPRWITTVTLSDHIDTGHLASIVAHITLPNLTIYLLTNAVDPTILGDFLLRHPHVNTWIYMAPDPLSPFPPSLTPGYSISEKPPPTGCVIFLSCSEAPPTWSGYPSHTTGARQPGSPP
ncbi:hypothetical protein C8J57DRAFT_1514857 [Mycena rebaudengoi]|nr:hypothetical protein C8J57DRAFT_1514857 [Mycena rebaudengoi]